MAFIPKGERDRANLAGRLLPVFPEPGSATGAMISQALDTLNEFQFKGFDDWELFFITDSPIMPKRFASPVGYYDPVDFSHNLTPKEAAEIAMALRGDLTDND